MEYIHGNMYVFIMHYAITMNFLKILNLKESNKSLNGEMEWGNVIIISKNIFERKKVFSLF